MAKRGLERREKLLAVMAATVIGGMVLVFWVVLPLWNRIEAARSEVEVKQQKLNSVKRLLSRQSAITQQHEALKSYLPGREGEQGTTILDELQSEASRLGLQLNLKPRGLRSEAGDQYFELEIEVQGRQEPVLSYIDAVLRLKSATIVERIRVNNAPTRDHQLKGSILLRQVLIES